MNKTGERKWNQWHVMFLIGGGLQMVFLVTSIFGLEIALYAFGVGMVLLVVGFIGTIVSLKD